MSRNYLIACALGVLFCVSGVRADLPVHCLHEQILGAWTFHRSKVASSTLSSCSHAGSYVGGGDFALGKANYAVADSIQVQLDSPNKASATIDGKKVHGTWTMMYDEGFEVMLGTHKYFAFSKYTGSGKHTTSHCGKTFPGWFHTDPEKKTWGCYHGIKNTAVPTQKFRRFGEGKSLGFMRDAGGDIVAPRGNTQGHAKMHAMPTAEQDAVTADDPDLISLVQTESFEEAHKVHMKRDFYADQAHVVTAVNKGHKEGRHTWHATHYPTRSIGEMGTWKHDYKGLGSSDSALIQSWREAASKQVDDQDIPKHFDWGNVKGKNYVPPVRNQRCGSCYAFSTRDMMEARVAIMKKQPISKEKLSVQSVLSCNYYSQGCAGGFPYTVAKYYQDVGAVGDEQQPSNADWHGPGEDPSVSKPDKVQCKKNAKPLARAWAYKYVGGFYGATNEKAMRRDIFDHGPLAVCFQVGLGFGNYRGGVFRQEASLPRQDHYGRVNHAVLITGFGETGTGQKYWKVKNSWGQNWGDDGYFKIERGTNQLNMEGDAVAAYPSAGASMHTTERMELSESHGTMLLEEEVVLGDVGANEGTEWVAKQDVKKDEH